jgi:hypothetical protein
MKKSDQLLAELNALKARRIELKEERADIAERLEEISEELNDLEPLYSYGYRGKIREVNDAYEEALMEEQDGLLPSPVWVKAPSRIGEKLLIARKPTPKRIYIKKVGCKDDFIYSKADGMYCGILACGILDVDETIAAWEKYQKEVNEASN